MAAAAAAGSSFSSLSCAAAAATGAAAAGTSAAAAAGTTTAAAIAAAATAAVTAAEAAATAATVAATAIAIAPATAAFVGQITNKLILPHNQKKCKCFFHFFPHIPPARLQSHIPLRATVKISPDQTLHALQKQVTCGCLSHSRPLESYTRLRLSQKHRNPDLPYPSQNSCSGTRS